MYRITYFVQWIDENGVLRYQPDYDMFFKTTDPSNDTIEQKLLLVKASFARRFPQCQVVNAKVVSEGWV